MLEFDNDSGNYVYNPPTFSIHYVHTPPREGYYNRVSGYALQGPFASRTLAVGNALEQIHKLCDGLHSKT
jgi:hypothetical protein